MDAFTWFYFFICSMIGLVAIVAGPIIISLFWFRWLPKAARTLFWCRRRMQPPALIFHDSGRSAIRMIQERRGEGVVYTNAGRYKILPRYVEVERALGLDEEPETALPKGALPEGVNLPAETTTDKPSKHNGDEKKKPTAREIHLIKTYAEWVSRRSYLTGLGLPIFLGYSGTLCLMNPEALALYEAGEMKILDSEGKWLFNPLDKKNEDGTDKDIEKAMQPLMMLDGRRIKTVIQKSYDASQMAAIVVDAIEVGRLGKGLAKYAKFFAIFIIMIIVGLGLMFLPQILAGLGMG